jgi:hypothetical protein
MERIPDPFAWLGEEGQWRLFLLSLVLGIVIMVALNDQGRYLQTAEAPDGIVTFELIGSKAGADRILNSWGERGRVVAGLNLGLDYLFMLVYAAGLGLGAVIAGRSHARFSLVRAGFGRILAWASLLAGLLDAIENYALIRVLLGADGDFWPVLSRWCARPKFAIVGVVLAYVLSAPLITRLLARSR